jgi:excisionase family DNA binding protein
MSTVERRPTDPEPLTRSDVLTATEASALLGIPRSTLYDLARRQELPARQIGRRWIFRRSLLHRATLTQSEAGHVVATFGSDPAPTAGISSKRTTGLEPATFGLGSRRSTN